MLKWSQRLRAGPSLEVPSLFQIPNLWFFILFAGRTRVHFAGLFGGLLCPPPAHGYRFAHVKWLSSALQSSSRLLLPRRLRFTSRSYHQYKRSTTPSSTTSPRPAARSH